MLNKTSYKMKPPISVKIVRGYRLSRGLVGCLLFNERSGSKVFDLSGHNHIGSLQTGCVWVPGKFGTALEFDGNGYIDFVELPTASETLSVSLWINPTWSGVGRFVISSNAKGGAQGLVFALLSVAAGMYVNRQAVNQPLYDQPTNGVWTHVVITAVDFTTAPKLYYDAVLQMDNGGSNYGTPVSEQIGAREGISNFSGLIDHVMFYDRVLSPSEIDQLYIRPFCMFGRRDVPVLSEVFLS